jgi:hypothetical protein
MNTLPSLCLIAIICASFSSCSSSGTPYTETKNSGALAPHQGKGKLLIYRTSGLAGKAMKPFVWVNNVKFPQPLSRGGFYSYDATPGPLKAEFAWHDHYSGVGETAAIALTGGLVGVGIDHLMGHKRKGLNIQVAPGQTHYILFDGHKLSEVSKDEAEGELQDCAWLNPAAR